MKHVLLACAFSMVVGCVLPAEEQSAPVCDPVGTYHLTFTRDPANPGTCPKDDDSLNGVDYTIESNGADGYRVARMSLPHTVTISNNNCIMKVAWTDTQPKFTISAQMLFEFSTPQGAFLMSYVDPKLACTAFYKMGVQKK